MMTRSYEVYRLGRRGWEFGSGVLAWRSIRVAPQPCIVIHGFGYRRIDFVADHTAYRRWLEESVGSDQPYGLAESVLAGFLRVVTHPKVFSHPSTLDVALRFIEELRDQPNCVVVAPGSRHWEIFVRLCRVASAKGNLIPDAYFAALAIESGSEWITTDRDYSRFAGLRWRHPLQ